MKQNVAINHLLILFEYRYLYKLLI